MVMLVWAVVSEYVNVPQISVTRAGVNRIIRIIDADTQRFGTGEVRVAQVVE